MNAHWTAAVLLSAGLIAGCNTQDAQDIEEQPSTAAEDESLTGTATDRADSASGTEDSPSRNDTPRAGTTPRAETPRAGTPSTAKPAPAEPQYRELRVASGTALPLELQTAISSETATIEMPVQARLTQGISVEGVTVLPAGTQLTGTVTEVQQSGRVKGRARVTFAFTQATVNGARHTLRTDPITFEAQGTQGEDATKIGVGAGVGAAIGGILGGGSGAAKGAAIGGAAGTGRSWPPGGSMSKSPKAPA